MPELRVHIPIQEIRRMADQAVRSLEEKSEVRQTLAQTVKPLVEEDFRAKSLGGSGAGGLSWAPISARTAQTKRSKRIGVDTGELEKSLRVSEGHSQRADVLIEYTAPHAAEFDKKRTLLPTELPQQWRGPMEADVAKWGESKMQKAVNQS